MKPRILSVTRLSLPFALAIAALLGAPNAHAVNLWWDTNGVTATPAVAATGTWTAASTANWTTVLAGNIATVAQTTTNADDLTFNSTGMSAGTITVSGTQLARTITFNTATTLSGGTAIDLGNATAGSGLFFGNQANTISTPIILNSAATAIAITNSGNQTQTFGGTITGSAAGLQTITIGGLLSAGGQMNFNGIISNGLGGGTVAVTVNAQSTTTLAAANTYTGATNILAGTLQVNNATTFANTSAINLGSTARLTVNAVNASLAELTTTGGGSGLPAGSFLRYSQAQTTSTTSPDTVFGTVELNITNVNPNYTLDFGTGSALTNTINTAIIYTSPLTLSGTASIDASQANATHTATYSTGGITASSAGAKTLNLTGSNTGANTISSAIGNGSGTIALNKGGGGTWVLSGTNTYTGNTRIDGGTLQFTNLVSLYNNEGAAAWSNTNINVSSGATMAFNIGGGGQFTKANVIALLGLSNSASNGFMSGSSVGLDTTAGSFLYDSVIANTNSGANVLGLTKLGANTLTLDQDNTYTGRTVISAGTLQLGNGGTTGKLSTSSTILNNGNLTINRSDAVEQGTDFSAAPITGTGSFTKAGAGTTTLSAANTFSGTTTVSAGVLNLTNERALQNSAIVTTGAGTVTFTGFTTPVLGGLSGATGNLSTVIPGFASTTALSLNATAGSFTYGGVIGDGLGAGAMSLTKNGASTQILSGANTYTGATIVNAGTLTVGSAANGSISSSSTLQMGGGIFNYSRTGAGQTVNGLTVNAGNSTVNNTSAGQTLTLGAITRTASVYGTVNFATLAGSITTTTGNTNSILGPWATTGSTTTLRYAVGSADGITATNISALTGTAATATTLANVTDPTANYDYTGAATTAADLTANTLRFSGTAATTAIGAANKLTLNGLMNASGGNTYTISGGPSTGGIIIGSTNELVIAANAQNTTISAVIKDGGAAGTMVYSGGSTGSTLTLSGANLYSGGTVINSGTVALADLVTGAIGTGPITINSGGNLNLNRTSLNRAVTLNGGTLRGPGNVETVSGTIALTANSTLDYSQTNFGTGVINSAISGAGGLTKTSAGVLRFNNISNTYTGPTVISAGGIVVKSSLYGNDTSKWTPANITVAANAVLGMNVGGAGEFSTSDAATMFTNLTTNVNNNGLLPGSIPTIYTTNAPAGTYTYSAVLADSTGPGGGSVNFKFFGTATTTLELTGANTYSGATLIENNGTLKVSSFNSVFTNPTLGTVHTASSSLGAPTTVANGTIWLGNGGWNGNQTLDTTYQGANLVYTGAGETTDRVLNIAGAQNTIYTLDQSGSGLLKFTSAITFTEGRGAKTIILQGSTAGTGELAGTVPIIDFANPTKLTKQGTGTWTLSGANTYTGVTTVSGGALVLAHANALNGGIGATGGLGALTFNGGVIGLGAGNFSRPLAAANTVGAATFTGAGGWAACGADRTVNLGGASASITWATANTGLNSQTLILGNITATHTVDLQNPLDLGNAVRTVQVDNGAAAIDGKLSGILSGAGGGLTKTGLGTLFLTNTNSYTGATAVQAGTVVAGTNAPSASNGALGNAATEVNLGVAGGNNNAGILIGGAFDVGRNIRLLTNNTTDTGTRVLTLGGSTADNSTFSGNIILGTESQAGRGVNLTAASGGQVTFSGVIQNPATMDPTTYSVAKEGLGTVVLSNANTYTGATAVNAGTLSVTGSLGATAVSVNAGTLTGNGNFGGDVTIAPGATHSLAVAATSLAQDTSAITGTLAMADSILNLTAASTPAAGEYVLATATSITGTPTTINYNGITGTVSVDTVSNPDRLLLTVTGDSAYDSWATLKGLTGLNNAKNLDPDNDGKNNLYEFAFDGNPLSGVNDGKIVGKIATVGADQVLTLTLPVRAVAAFAPDAGTDQLSALIDGIYYRIEGDVNLNTFADGITEVTGGDATTIQTGMPALSGAGWTYRTFRAPGTVAVDPKAFLRAKVSETP
jgi:autotransporter-associated beta strand protein